MKITNQVVTSSNDQTTTQHHRSIEELTINWHVTEACNYKCQYCYAKWRDSPSDKELFNDSEKSEALLIKLYDYFNPTNLLNSLQSDIKWSNVRLNLAGGEPFLLNSRLVRLVKKAREIGFNVSLITNGSRLTEQYIRELAPYVSCLGISVDSTNDKHNHLIGRFDSKGRVLNTVELSSYVKLARQLNPDIYIKLNTVVNQVNVHSDFSELLKCINPERWKVLRVLPVITDALKVEDAEFQTFVKRHHGFSSISCIEDNSDMTESYLMVDPFGRFFQNDFLNAGEGYSYSQEILEVGAEEAFNQINFNTGSFTSRYISDLSEEGRL